MFFFLIDSPGPPYSPTVFHGTEKMFSCLFALNREFETLQPTRAAPCRPSVALSLLRADPAVLLLPPPPPLPPADAMAAEADDATTGPADCTEMREQLVRMLSVQQYIFSVLNVAAFDAPLQGWSPACRMHQTCSRDALLFYYKLG